MNQIPRCDWLPEWARWSYVVLGAFIPYGKSFIYLACSVKFLGGGGGGAVPLCHGLSRASLTSMR